MPRRFLSLCVALVGLMAVAILPPPATAATVSFIRDAEIETTIRVYATPIFRAAGLDPSAVRIYLVNDRQINAFVAGGQNLFLNTGFLMRTQNASQVIGVIAHECGHIAGGHLARVHDALKKSTAESIVGLVLGTAAAVAGRPDVGAAVMAGGQHAAVRDYLQYSRTQEASADAAAMHYLDATKESSRGLLEFFQILSADEAGTQRQQDPYVRTHPLTRERIETLAAFVEKSPYSDTPAPPDYEIMHQRMVAKLHGFLDNPTVLLRQIPADDKSMPARYMRAIALHRATRLDESLAEIDSLLNDYPNDPYFLELKGQVLFESGRVVDALQPYEQSVERVPEQSLIRVDLARVQLATQDPALLDSAVSNLRTALLDEHDRPFVWHQLAIALGRRGDLGESAAALAEEAYLRGDRKNARYQANRAIRALPAGSPEWLRAEDIIRTLDQEKDD